MDDDGFFATVAAIEQAQTLEEVRSLAHASLRAAGVSRAVYHHVPPMGHPDADAVQVAAEGFPEEAVARYVGRQLYRRNRVLLGALASTHPVVASTYGPFETDDPELREMLVELRRLVPDDWLVVPVFGPSARNGAFGLIFEGDLPPIDSDPVRRLVELCQAIHLRVCHLIEGSHTAPPKLSARETTVLGWVARGKSNGEIATILTISPHTVDAHLRRIYLKLDVTDRVSAAIRGVGYGYILRVKT